MTKLIALLFVLVGCTQEIARGESTGPAPDRALEQQNESTTATGTAGAGDDVADAAAPMVQAVHESDAGEPANDATAADAGPHAQPAIDAGAPVPPVDAGHAPAPIADAGSAPSSDAGTDEEPAPVEVTVTCKISATLSRGCDAFTQQHYPTIALAWGFDPDWDGTSPQVTYSCGSKPLTACASGAPCSIYDSNTGNTQQGKCL